MPDDIRKLLRAGRYRLWSVRCVAALCSWILPLAGAVLVIALLQRLGVVPVFWGAVAMVGSSALVGAVLLHARPWSVRPADAALALDSALGLDDRLGSALAAQGSDDPMALSTIEQARSAVSGRVRGNTVRRALPLKWTRSFPMGLVVLLLAVIVAGEPASKVMADEARNRVQSELAAAIDAVSPLAPDDKAIVRALELAKLPLPEADSAEAIELEALRRITELQKAVELVEESDSVLASNDVAEALRNMNASPSGETDVDALREALAARDFDAAGQVLNDLASETKGTVSNGARREAMEGLAKDLERAAARAAALNEERKAAGKSSSQTAEQALQQLAEDLRRCQDGQCDKPGGACKKLEQCQGQGQSASSASSACSSAASNCMGAGPRPGLGPQVAEDDSETADPTRPSAPEAPQDEAAEVIDVEAAPPSGLQVGAAPISPVGVGTTALESRGAPSPEELRRLPARYQEAVRRFFSTSRGTTPEAPPKDDP